MYRLLLKAGACCAVALGLWMATPEAQAQRRGWSGGWGRGWSSPGISFGVDRGGFYAGPSYGGRYGGWDGYGRSGWDSYGRYGYGRGFDRGWYGSTYWPRTSYYSSPGYYSYSYPSTMYYSSPAVTYSYPSTTYYDSAPATTYYESSPSYSGSAASVASTSDDSARIRVHVPEPTAQLWFNDSPTQQRGMERVFETPALRDDRTNTYEIRAKWQDEDGRTIERTQTVRVEPGAQEVVSFGQTE